MLDDTPGRVPPSGDGAPPEGLIRSLLNGPSLVRGFEWHDAVDSTNTLAIAAAEAGAPEIHVIAADEQRAGRGRLGRGWQAPPGTSLMCSWLLRPPLGLRQGLIPLMVGVALAQTASAHVPDADVALKWPNDLLIAARGSGERKAAGVLVEAPTPGVVIVGTGVNVDWREVERPADLTAATSLSEAADRLVDRWRFFAGLVGVLTRRYVQLWSDPDGLLADYRARCVTLGRDVRVERIRGATIEGRAVDIDETGALVVASATESTVVHAGDVHHVRPTSWSG